MKRTRFWRRIAQLILGIVIIFWLPFEDTNIQAVLIMAITTAVLLSLQFSDSIHSEGIFASAVIGFAGGLAVSPITAALMLVKIGLHGHGNVPDFSFTDFASVFDRTLIFGAGGLFIGAGIMLFSHND